MLTTHESDMDVSPRTVAAIDEAEAMLLNMPQPPVSVGHRFAPGVYIRSIAMPAGAIIIGHAHRTEHFNILLSGRVRVLFEGGVQDLTAPYMFVSKPGVRKLLYIVEDALWSTVHATDETDIEKLEAMLTRPSEAWTKHNTKS